MSPGVARERKKSKPVWALMCAVAATAALMVVGALSSSLAEPSEFPRGAATIGGKMGPLTPPPPSSSPLSAASASLGRHVGQEIDEKIHAASTSLGDSVGQDIGDEISAAFASLGGSTGRGTGDMISAASASLGEIFGEEISDKTSAASASLADRRVGRGIGDEMRSTSSSYLFFKSIDLDGDGTVRSSELSDFVTQKIGGSAFDADDEVEEGVSNAMAAIDGDNDGGLDPSDMFAYWTKLESLLTADEVAEWIVHAVQLPESVGNIFKENVVTGYDFPELVENDGEALRAELGIEKQSFRKKIVRHIRTRMLGVGTVPAAPPAFDHKLESCSAASLRWGKSAAKGFPVHGYRMQRRVVDLIGGGDDERAKQRLGSRNANGGAAAESCTAEEMGLGNESSGGEQCSVSEATGWAGGTSSSSSSSPLFTRSASDWVTVYHGFELDFVDPSLEYGHNYFYRVQAWNSFGRSEWTLLDMSKSLREMNCTTLHKAVPAAAARSLPADTASTEGIIYSRNDVSWWPRSILRGLHVIFHFVVHFVLAAVFAITVVTFAIMRVKRALAKSPQPAEVSVEPLLPWLWRGIDALSRALGVEFLPRSLLGAKRDRDTSQMDTSLMQLQAHPNQSHGRPSQQLLRARGQDPHGIVEAEEISSSVKDISSVTTTAKHDEAVQCGSALMSMLISSADHDPCPVPLPYLEQCTEGFSEKRKLGEGSFSCVYEGRDRAIRRKFAVKRLRVRVLCNVSLENARNTFEREIVTLKHFRHPNIARMFAYHLSKDLQGEHCLVYELASNGCLYNAIKRKDTMHWTTRISIALDVSKALSYLHSGTSGQVCFHRDVKSANVVLRRDNTALLIDCGVSKMIPNGDSSDLTMTIMDSSTSNGIRGTPGYICPMFSRRQGRYSSANDVFSMGVVFAEIFTGLLQNSCLDGEDVDMFDKFSADGIEKGNLENDADESAGDWDEAIRREFSQMTSECLLLNPAKRPSIADIVQRLGDLASKARPRSPGERNHITVLSSSPLVYTDDAGDHFPLPDSLNFGLERELLQAYIKESRRNIRLTFDTATDDRLQAAVTRRCGCLHFSGHGHPGMLLFEDNRGGAHWMKEDILRDCVHKEPFRFVFVSACYSLLMGKALVNAGVHHVVCCEHDKELRDDAALKFTQTFYHALAEGYTISAAFQKGKMAVGKLFENEAEKFVLLPNNENHEVPLFDAEVLEWAEETSPARPIPPAPEHFLGREIDVYSVLQLVLNHRLVNVIGSKGIGCSSLAAAVSHYINTRMSTILSIESIYFVRRKGCISDSSSLKQLHEQLEKEGRLQCLQDDDDSLLATRIIRALRGEKALVVFDGVASADRALLSFSTRLLESTVTTRLLLTSSEAVDITSAFAERQVFELGPLSAADTALLFSKACPYADTRTKEEIVVDRIMKHAPASSLSLLKKLRKVRKGIPAQILKVAKSLPQDAYESLFKA